MKITNKHSLTALDMYDPMCHTHSEIGYPNPKIHRPLAKEMARYIRNTYLKDVDEDTVVNFVVVDTSSATITGHVVSYLNVDVKVNILPFSKLVVPTFNDSLLLRMRRDKDKSLNFFCDDYVCNGNALIKAQEVLDKYNMQLTSALVFATEDDPLYYKKYNGIEPVSLLKLTNWG